jgi:hypothetical protein
MKYSIHKDVLEIIGWQEPDGTEVMIEHPVVRNDHIDEGRDVIINCYRCEKLFCTTERQYDSFDFFVCIECYKKEGAYLRENKQ